MKFALFICLLLIVSCGQKPGEVKKDAFAENAELLFFTAILLI